MPARKSCFGFSVRDGAVVPHYLTERDHVWLRALCDEYERFAGRPRRELDERLREPLPCASPGGKRMLAAHVLDRVFPSRSASAVPAPAARAAVFAAAAAWSDDRARVFDEVARELGASPTDVEDALFADVPGERRVAPPDRPIGPAEIALRANLALVQGLLHRAVRVEAEMVGNARPVIRHAKLRGLICTVLPRDEGDAAMAKLEISGPLSILRRTLLYGRALAELVPLLAWCARFRLRSECVLGGAPVLFALQSGDPVFPSAEPRLYDSRVEERLAKDFRKLAPDWDVIREPEPVRAGEKLIFPDFALVHRREPERRWLLEVLGFWTREYVERKLADLRAARIESLILCIDEERNVGDGDLPPQARIVRYRRRIDARAVLAAVGAAPA